MPLDPFAQLPVGATGVSVTRLGFGTAPLGGLYSPFPHDEAVALVRHAWETGVRYFDTAPLYGYGLAEERLAEVLADKPRDSFTISTKVGRLIRPASGAELEGGRFFGTRDERPVWDFSRDGVLRSIEESLRRLKLDRVEIVLIHDPDDHWQQAIDEAYPALDDLRSQGVIGAIGAGMNQSEMLTRFVREARIDILLCAGRYTLLDQDADRELLPACLERGTKVIIGGLMNSGILADPRPGATFNYETADPAWVAKAQRLREICTRHGVPLKHAAIQFPLAHPAVVTVAAGVRQPAELDDYPAAMATAIPAALWAELKAEGLLPAHAPVPA